MDQMTRLDQEYPARQSSKVSPISLVNGICHVSRVHRILRSLQSASDTMNTYKRTIRTPWISEVDGIIHHLVPDRATIPGVDAVVDSIGKIPFPTVPHAVVIPHDTAWNPAFAGTSAYFANKTTSVQISCLASFTVVLVRIPIGRIVVLSRDDVDGGKVATSLWV